MVSLNTHNVGRSGGISFDDRPTIINDEILHDHTPLIVNTEQPYRSIRTTGFIILHIVFVILFETVVVLLPYLCYDRAISKQCESHSAYNISLYIHASAYFVGIIFDRLYHHYQELSRRDGYLTFYRQTRNLRRTPLITISIGNAILVAMIKLLEDYQSRISPVQPWHCLAILTTVEVLIILIVLLRYLVLTIRFNRQCARPDAAQEDFLSTFVPLQSNTTEIGFRDETYTDNILEKQADLIRYLRERNDHLARLVHQQSRRPV